jgi:alpha-2-macroglobulin-like protein
MDAYTLAVVANFAVERGKDSELTRRALELLNDSASRKDEFVWWSADETSVYATGDSAAVETTGLALQAFLKAGGYPDVVRKSLTWITSKKNGSGNWGTTQATIMALRALLRASEQSGSAAYGKAQVLLNGKQVASVEINRENNDLLHQFVLPQVNMDRDNEVEIRFSGEGGLAYQIAGRYFVPGRKRQRLSHWQSTSGMIARDWPRTRLLEEQR